MSQFITSRRLLVAVVVAVALGAGAYVYLNTRPGNSTKTQQRRTKEASGRGAASRHQFSHELLAWRAGREFQDQPL